ncbi:MAG: helix-turn-helix domain-containing protein [Gordonia sp. (in: high G+C Gram-positive bacteria)]|uniref:helix-turn-helix transcriptional regulator n=1 Tax=Gordonia sp. (in: high G+C Gram-positive bacteria) TaxID=84139 RepID=UPI0039E680AE
MTGVYDLDQVRAQRLATDIVDLDLDLEQRPQRLLNVTSMAALLDCTTRQVYRMNAAGHIPPGFHLGQALRWRELDVAAWIESLGEDAS